MHRLQKLNTQLRILHGQRARAFAVRDYSLVMFYSQEIARIRKRIKQEQKRVG